MRFLSALIGSWRHQRTVGRLSNKIVASWKRRRTVAGMLSDTEGDPIEQLLDYCESNPSVQRVMISEFNDHRPWTRDDLKGLFLSLTLGGLEVREAVHAIATPHTLRFIAQSMKRGDGRDKIVSTLIGYYGSMKAKLE